MLLLYLSLTLYNRVYFVFCNCMFLIPPLGCNINKVELIHKIVRCLWIIQHNSDKCGNNCIEFGRHSVDLIGPYKVLCKSSYEKSQP